MEVRPLLKQRSGVTAGCFCIAGFTALKRRFFKRKNNKTGVFTDLRMRLGQRKEQRIAGFLLSGYLTTAQSCERNPERVNSDRPPPRRWEMGGRGERPRPAASPGGKC